MCVSDFMTEFALATESLCRRVKLFACGTPLKKLSCTLMCGAVQR